MRIPDHWVEVLLRTKLLLICRCVQCDPLFCRTKFHPSIALIPSNLAVRSCVVKMLLVPAMNCPMEHYLNWDILDRLCPVRCHLPNHCSTFKKKCSINSKENPGSSGKKFDLPILTNTFEFLQFSGYLMRSPQFLFFLFGKVQVSANETNRFKID